MNQLIIPEMGTKDQAEIIEILIAAGDRVELEQSTLVLEIEKTTLEVPATSAGVVKKLLVKIGDKLASGDAYAEIELAEATAETKEEPVAESAIDTPPVVEPATIANTNNDDVYAGPAVRRLARELGVDLSQVTGTGLKQRIQKEDVKSFVQKRMQTDGAVAANIPAIADIDFSQFGAVQEQPLNTIKRATAKAMTAAHLNVPQVTHFDEADITDLEAFRMQQNTEQAAAGIKYSIVPFVLKALTRCLVEHPHFNASINAKGDALIIKEYINIGVAVDTPKGLLVPVLRDVEQLSIGEIQQRLQLKAEKARSGTLNLQEMQGGNMSLSSLGGIGGTAFTPIVNPPEVAILGLSKATLKPVWEDGQFVPRLMLPLSLSYDHRAIDGAEAARFSRTLVRYLQDLRHLLM